MGMFDYLYCGYPLPEKPKFASDETDYQTKSFDCELASYRIGGDGVLRIRDAGEFHPFTFAGEVEFYGGNSVGSDGEFKFTQNGEDCEWVEYLATFVQGKLTNIVQTSYECSPALPASAIINSVAPTPEEIAAWEKTKSASYIGKQLWVAWGGKPASAGYQVDVVAESDQEIVVRKPPNDWNSSGRFETIDRCQFGSTLFETMEQAVARDRERAAEREAKFAKYAELLKGSV